MKRYSGASNLLAIGKLSEYATPMRTLHLRNVPDDVMERLERMARAASTSVTAVAIRELDAATRRQQIYGGSLDSVLLELASITIAPYAPWSSDRSLSRSPRSRWRRSGRR